MNAYFSSISTIFNKPPFLFMSSPISHNINAYFDSISTNFNKHPFLFMFSRIYHSPKGEIWEINISWILVNVPLKYKHEITIASFKSMKIFMFLNEEINLRAFNIALFFILPR